MHLATMNSHVFLAKEICVEIEVFYIKCHKLMVGRYALVAVNRDDF
jgi:hypothetical protein